MAIGAEHADSLSHKEMWAVAGLPLAARINARFALNNDPTGRELLAHERPPRAEEPAEPSDAVM